MNALLLTLCLVTPAPVEAPKPPLLITVPNTEWATHRLTRHGYRPTQKYVLYGNQGDALLYKLSADGEYYYLKGGYEIVPRELY